MNCLAIRPRSLAAAASAAAIACGLAGAPGARAGEERASGPGSAPDSAREWFQDARFGLFIHWGVYSLLGKGEWVMNNDRMPISEYEKLPPRFNPVGFDAAEWVSIARRAGQKYITITSKHHDGFCMWGTKQTRYNVVDGAPYGKDILRMLSDECRKQGIKLFFYHSHLDWHHPDYFPRGRTGRWSGRPESGDWGRYMDYLNAQIAELCSPPYEPAGIWFDGWWDRPDADWQLGKTYGIIHRLRPEALVGNNHHRAPFPGEDFQMFEQDLPGKNTAGFNEASVSALPLETCRTMNNSWGYNGGDKNYRPLAQQIRYLVEAAGLGANLLLNVGPTPEGKIPPEAVEILLGMGNWLERSGESIYATRPGPWGPSRWGRAVRRGRRAYLHVLDRPADGRIELPAIDGARSAAILGGGDPVGLQNAGGRLRIDLPASARDPIDLIVTVEFDRDLDGIFVAVPPPRVKVDGEETVLRAQDAESTGGIRLEGDPKNALGYWGNPKDTVTWRIEASGAGARDAVLTYACAPGSGGSEFEVSCGESKVRGKVYETGDWASFVSVPLGLLSIPAGPAEIVVRALSKPEGAAGVMNLRGIALQGGFESLFNGKDLSGWKYGRKDGGGYGVEDGIIVCPADGGGNLYTEREYDDFTFRFEFRLYRGSNNGLGIRAPGDGSDAAYSGMEIQILDDPRYEGRIESWQHHGSIYGVVPARPGHLREVGEWNVEEVHCKGRRVRVTLNGAVIVDADLDEAKNSGLRGLERHLMGLARPSGHIGFLGHGTRVDFRGMRIRDL